MSAFTLLIKRTIENGLYIESKNGDVRRATLRDLDIIVPAWPKLVTQIQGARQ